MSFLLFQYLLLSYFQAVVIGSPMANQLKGIARTEALLELGTPVDPSHQPVERYPGGSGGKVEHGELCLPVTSVFYHNLFFLVCFCQLLLSSVC